MTNNCRYINVTMASSRDYATKFIVPAAALYNIIPIQTCISRSEFPTHRSNAAAA